MTKSARAGVNIDAAFTKQVESRRLYSNEENMTIRTQNKSSPQAKFSRVDLGDDVFIWAPTNDAGEKYIRSLTETERNEFLTHEMPEPAAPSESHRVVDGRAIKGLPRGHREADYYNDDGSRKTPPHLRGHAKRPSERKAAVDEREPEPLSKEAIDEIRALVSAGTF